LGLKSKNKWLIKDNNGNYVLLDEKLNVMYGVQAQDEYASLGHLVEGTFDWNDFTSKDYAKTCGEFCPFCGSLNVDTTGSLDHCAHAIYQGCRCVSCKKEWTDDYTLTGFEEVHDEESDD